VPLDWLYLVAGIVGLFVGLYRFAGCSAELRRRNVSYVLLSSAVLLSFLVIKVDESIPRENLFGASVVVFVGLVDLVLYIVGLYHLAFSLGQAKPKKKHKRRRRHRDGA
jgi:hypothetical protein